MALQKFPTQGLKPGLHLAHFSFSHRPSNISSHHKAFLGSTPSRAKQTFVHRVDLSETIAHILGDIWPQRHDVGMPLIQVEFRSRRQDSLARSACKPGCARSKIFLGHLVIILRI
ncbi:hypothetical protein IF2G_05299 [Cordyceps javanica]|nr:hypothetical protein IF2G_05299 [Cordyceps javanica]